MKIVEIRLANIMCFEEKVIRLGQVTTVTGANGVGKSTIAESVKNVIGGGNDVTLLRSGAEEGEIALLLDDGMEIVKRITPKGSTVTVKHPEYGRISKPQSVIESLAQIAAVNPVSFLTMPEKKRAEYLLEMCPITVTDAEVEAALVPAGLTLGADGLDNDGRDLEGLDSIRKWVYDQRTSVNGILKDKRSTIATLSASLPEDRSELERDLAAEIAAREAARKALVADGESRIENVANATLLALQRVVDEKEERAAAVRMVHDTSMRRIDEAIRQLERERADIESAYKSKLAEIDRDASNAREKVIEEHEGEKQEIREGVLPQVTALDAEIAGLTEAARHADRYRQIAGDVERYTTQAAELEEKSAQLTSALERLDDLKRRKLSELPIEGIEIRDGMIYRNDVPFDRLNTAQRVDIAFELAVLRAGKLPFVFVDGAECLDQESQAELERRALDAGVQLMTFAVSDGPLEIATEEEVLA